MIVDEVKITVEAGQGGNGCSSFRREKYVPRGGPDGGNGGRGGDIFLEATQDLNTLVEFTFHPLFRARHGEHGKGKNMHGKDATPVIIRVPVGTLVWDSRGELVVDMNKAGDRFLIAKGGRGGRGNSTFTTATRQAPRLAEKGEPGEQKELRLELKLLADVGLVGYPNAGKSTLLSRVTRAHPKIADYPFTTLEPQLGVVSLSEGRSFVLADIPGLIEGASQGRGLGIKFLRHLERTRLLLHLVELTSVKSFAELEKRIRVIQTELGRHSEKFKDISQVIVFTKLDAAQDKPYREWMDRLKKKGKKVFSVSAVTGEGLRSLVEECWKSLSRFKKKQVVTQGEKESILYQPKSRFKIEEADRVFHVTGAEIKKWVAMTNLDSRDALDRFHRILTKMGVVGALKARGIQEGDKVYCEDVEMSFSEGRIGGGHES